MLQVRSGRGYDRDSPAHDADLTEVGRGTPMGELLRRYWHPIGLVTDADTTPKPRRVLGEDLVLFRDKSGRPGLLYARCAHRGANLVYGRCDDDGIRCCYHGWMFDAEGHCLDQPLEPDGGRARAHVRQPWYPVREQYGLIWAYLGPQEKQPSLPRYEIFETRAADEFIVADDNSIGGGGPVILPCNWLQHYENVLDSAHFPWLHFLHSGPQFGVGPDGLPDPATFLNGVHWEDSDHGVKTVGVRSIVECVLPTLRCVPNPRATVAGSNETRCEMIGWVLPIDDTSYRIYTVGRVRDAGEMRATRAQLVNGTKTWDECTPQEHRAFPGDYEAQVGQGPMTFHSEEHLTATDRGVVMLRRRLREQLQALAEGRDPINVSFDLESAPVVIDARRHDPSAV